MRASSFRTGEAGFGRFASSIASVMRLLPINIFSYAGAGCYSGYVLKFRKAAGDGANHGMHLPIAEPMKTFGPRCLSGPPQLPPVRSPLGNRLARARRWGSLHLLGSAGTLKPGAGAEAP